MDPPPVELTKSKADMKLERDDVKIKLHINPTSTRFDIYEFIIDLFDNVEPEEFLPF